MGDPVKMVTGCLLSHTLNPKPPLQTRHSVSDLHSLQLPTPEHLHDEGFLGSGA